MISLWKLELIYGTNDAIANHYLTSITISTFLFTEYEYGDKLWKFVRFFSHP